LFESDLERVEKEGLYRSLRRIGSSQGRVITVGGREILQFCSNDYLSLANHPKIIQTVIECINKYGWGSGAARLISGSMGPHLEFEEHIAQFLDKPAGLLYSSGYLTNVGIITSLMGRKDKIFADRLCHASIIDGMRWSGAKINRFRHNDPDDLKRLIERSTGGGKLLIVSDGVFSMDGDIAPLKELAELAERYGAILMIDDAHGFGIFGPEGRGVPHHFGVCERVNIHVATLGKALGGAGGFVTGSRSFIDGLINFSRSFIFSTAPPPAQAAAGLASLELIAGTEGAIRRKRLMKSVERALRELAGMGYNTAQTKSQIIPIIIERDDLAAGFAKSLFDNHILAPLIRPPSVPKGTSRIRVSLCADHEEGDIGNLIKAFADLKSLLIDKK
tara:strand:+ start:9167 stop:10336 length:1170 start_codon:yes stop_codon:yes gene_type:complete